MRRRPVQVRRSRPADGDVDDGRTDQRLSDHRPLRRGLRRREAIDTVWLLIDSVLHQRLTTHPGWTAAAFRRWFTTAVLRLLTDDTVTPPVTGRDRLMSDHEPQYRTGKVCYLEIPSTDVARSATFYGDVFGWPMRRRGDGALAFDDTVGQVSGSFVPGRPADTTPGLLVHVMVADVATILDAIVAAGGSVVRPVDPDDHEVYAWFADPDGNVLGVYQQPGLAELERAKPS